MKSGSTITLRTGHELTTDEVSDLVEAVRHMRYHQQRYFQNRTRISPREAIRTEQAVDRLLRNMALHPAREISE